jgi:hypothetical protein
MDSRQEYVPPASPSPTSRPHVSRSGDRFELSRAEFEGWIDWTSRRGCACFPYAAQVTAIESVLRIAYNFLALEQDGLLLHAAGVPRDGHGCLFPGRSGAGKSTIAGLATELRP